MVHELLREYVSLVTEKIRSEKGKSFGDDTKFNINTFKRLTSPGHMIAYANVFLQQLGSGSSRTAFLMSSKNVLKIAKNEKGIAQNEAEVSVSTNPQTKAIIAAVKSFDDSYRWVISDVVKEFKSSKEFEDATGMNFNELMSGVNMDTKTHEQPDPKHKLRSALYNTMLSNDLKMGDIHRYDHWGLTPDGRVVILDYGFTGTVYKKHYRDDDDDKDKTPGTNSLSPSKQKLQRAKKDDNTKNEKPLSDREAGTKPD